MHENSTSSHKLIQPESKIILPKTKSGSVWGTSSENIKKSSHKSVEPKTFRLIENGFIIPTVNDSPDKQKMARTLPIVKGHKKTLSYSFHPLKSPYFTQDISNVKNLGEATSQRKRIEKSHSKLVKSFRASTIDANFKRTAYSIGFSKFDAMHDSPEKSKLNNLDKNKTSNKAFQKFKKRSNIRKRRFNSQLNIQSNKVSHLSKIKKFGHTRSQSMSMNSSYAQFRNSKLTTKANNIISNFQTKNTSQIPQDLNTFKKSI